MNNNDTIELEQMREQMAKLREMLSKENLVNERMMRRAMSNKMDSLNRRNIAFIVVAVLFIPYMIFVVPMLGLHPIIGYVGVAFLAIAALYDTITLSQMRGDIYTYGTLLQIAEATVRYRRRNINWLFFSIPFLIIWVGAVAYSFIDNEAMLLGIGIGLVVGGAIGVHHFMAMLRTTREIINQINDLTR